MQLVRGIDASRVQQDLRERRIRAAQFAFIRGMRDPIETMLEELAAGMDIGDIVADYPELEKDVLAALDFAAALARTKRIDLLAA